MDMSTILVRYAEIALKGKNQPQFISRLVRNIREALGLRDDQITRQSGQILIEVEREHLSASLNGLAGVFGIAWFAEVHRCESTLEALAEAALALAGGLRDGQAAFAVNARRSEKSLSFTSADINNHVGALLQERTGARVDLNNPEVTVHISARKRESLIYLNRIDGPGGLPVGTNGRVLSLLSGGFDSIASSWYLARRGAEVDFLHFHALSRIDAVMASKMPALWTQLSAFTRSGRTYLADYAPFEVALLGSIPGLQRYELVAFRRLMVRVGERLAERYGYDGLVLGDSLGQVASQTMQNIIVVDRAVTIPIFRPLIGMDKTELIDLVRRIGMWDAATTAYKDCCSLIARHPSTQAAIEKVEALEESLGVDSLVEEIADDTTIVPIGIAEDEKGED